MTGITERARAVRERLAQRRAGGSKSERAQKKADAEVRRLEIRRGKGGGKGGFGPVGGA
jgi:hypothetical protein